MKREDGERWSADGTTRAYSGICECLSSLHSLSCAVRGRHREVILARASCVDKSGFFERDVRTCETVSSGVTSTPSWTSRVLREWRKSRRSLAG